MGPQGPIGPIGPQGPQGSVGSAISYHLAPDSQSKLITVPANQPVFVIATNTTPGNRGTGFISLEHDTGKGFVWAGVNSPDSSGSAKLAAGSASAPANMLTIDHVGAVVLRVVDADHFVVRNYDVRNNDAFSAQDGYVWIMAAP